MQNNPENLGDEGEQMARNWLKQKGYVILETNWRFRKYEVDIIAKKDETIVFVEVKSRKNNTFGEPEIFVTKQKQNFLIAAANQYIIQRDIDLETRFDIIAITWLNNNPTVKHLEGAFYPRVK